MLTRRILVTTVKTADGGRREIYGRFDAVAVAARGEKITKQEFQNFKLSEDAFVEAARKEMKEGRK